MIPQIIAQIGIPVLAVILSDVFTKMDSQLGRNAADALGKITGAIERGEISAEQVAEANRHAEKMAEMEMTQYQVTNETFRAEIASDDKFVRRMRPTFGYFMALTWAAQMLAVAYVIVFETEKSAFVINAMGNLSVIWAMGLSVLGIYVYKRSEEKRNTSAGPEIIAWNKTKS